jgi:hypothetical protein
MEHRRLIWQIAAFVAATWIVPPVGSALLAVALGQYAGLTWYTILATSIAAAIISYIAIRALLELADWLDRSPKLALIGLTRYPNEQLHGESSSTSICLYRITLENQTVNSRADNVRVRGSVKGIPLPTFDLHETHDNAAPFRQQRPVRHDEAIDFDLIAKENEHYQLFLWRADVGISQVYRLSHDEHDALQSEYLGEGFILTVTIVADPPAKVSHQSYQYRVRLLSGSELSVEPMFK